jgi:hypothetical protein
MAGMERRFIETDCFPPKQPKNKHPPNKSMKNIKHKTVLAAALLAGSLAIASAVPVVFNVNMSVQNALGNFHPDSGDGVRVLGLNGDWSTGFTMVPSSADANIYTVTNSLPVSGAWPNYKFVITPTSSPWIWESPANFGGGNRYFPVPAGGTNLPVVFFSDNTNLPSYTVQITFQLDMEIAILQGHFNFDSDYVDVFGSFNNWGNPGVGVLLTNVPGTSNYVGVLTTTALATNTLVSYKYAINGYGGTWEGNVGTNGAQNRSFTVTNLNQVLPPVYWNNITNADISFTVGFQVDMTVEDALGLFTPGVDVVFVNGDWSSFGGSDFQLTQTATANLYTGAVVMSFSPGTTVNYKYSIDGGLPWENGNVGPGGGQNRQFVLNVNTNLPLDHFNNYADLGPVFISRQGAQTALSWPSGTNVNNSIRLQTATNLLNGWSDVANTQGHNSITNDFGPGTVLFRLTGP